MDSQNMEIIIGILLGLFFLVGIAALVIIYLVRASLPRSDGVMQLRTGKHKILVQMDELGAPLIIASSRADAYRALGSIVARDRLFQIDLLRRSASGHLSEVYGPFTLEKDIQQRTLGLHYIAAEILRQLPSDQLEVLQAYADGINDYLRSMKVLPPECLLLRYTPQTWTAQDCILVGLYVFQDLTGHAEKYKRATAIMQQTLPADVVAFFTADEDLYPQVLLGGTESRRPLPPLPVESLKTLLQRYTTTILPLPQLDSIQQIPASNASVVGPASTYDGRAILAK